MLVNVIRREDLKFDIMFTLLQMKKRLWGRSVLYCNKNTDAVLYRRNISLSPFPIYTYIYAYIYLPREATKVVSRMGPCPYQKSTGQYVCQLLKKYD
jgi:hypothetical protein